MWLIVSIEEEKMIVWQKMLTNDAAHYIWFGGLLHKRKMIRQLILDSNAVHFSIVLWFTYAWRVVHFFVWENFHPTEETMQCTCPSDAVQYLVWSSSIFVWENFHPTKETMQCTCLSDAVRYLVWSSSISSEKIFISQKKRCSGLRSDTVQFFVRCSAVFSRMKYARRFGCREKQSARILVIWKLLLNRNELERECSTWKGCVSLICFQWRIIWIIPLSSL